MSLTKEDLQAISDLIDVKLEEYVQKVVRESEKGLQKEIDEIKRVTVDNCYNLVELKTRNTKI